MLRSLQIKNFALVERLNLEFSPHLNVLTGETGAGKSLLIDAIRFVLGERLDTIRTDSAAEGSCLVEAVFEISDKKLRFQDVLEPFLESGDEVLILRKELTGEGKSRCSINNKSVNNSTLKEAGKILLDIHGQYDHQLLFEVSSHLDLADRFSQAENLKADYRKLFEEYSSYLKERDELKALEEGREREIDLLKYQIDEMERAALKENEEEELKKEHIRLANAEKLYENAARLLSLLNEEEQSASNLLTQGYKEMSSLSRLDPSLEPLKSDYETVQLNLEEMIRALRDYQESLSFDFGRLAEIETRLDAVELLKKKYGGEISKILGFLDQARKKYDRLVHSGLYGKEIEQKIKKVLPALSEKAGQLAEKRKKASAQLKKMIETELRDLQIPNAQFECRMEKTDFSLSGQDQLEFMISLNPGQPLLALRKIISGGEASRVMLALKRALVKVDPVSTLIFDEIDANIGGRLGSVTGRKLKEISREHQVLLITHLPQIASFADRHFKVDKAVRNGKTFTQCFLLEGEERVKELAQMMSGKRETEISRKHAEEMLNLSGRK